MMEDIDKDEKSGSGATCGKISMIKCALPECGDFFPYKFGKKFCDPKHKRILEIRQREAGKKALTRGKIHAAKIERSRRLQVVAWFLADFKPHTTMEIILTCNVCAVNAIAGELRENGFDINCSRVSKNRYEYTMINNDINAKALLRIPGEAIC